MKCQFLGGLNENAKFQISGATLRVSSSDPSKIK
jgi:hypothetical protein